MGFDLAQYIDEQLKKGYSKDQIIVYLSRFGYSKTVIDEVFNKREHKSMFSNIFHKNRPINMQLVSFIEQNLAKGYDYGSISNYLKQYNYDVDDISKALHFVQKQSHQVNHTIDLSNKTIAFAFLFIILLGSISAGAYLFIFKTEPTKLLDYELKLEKSELAPGEKLYFTNTLVNMGTDRKYDIFIDYEISDFNTNKIIKTKSETIGASTIDTSARVIEIPSGTKPGIYRLESIARYGEDIATSHESFQVISSDPQATCLDGIKNQDETGIDCGGICLPCLVTSPTCSDGIKNQDETGIDCGGVCSPCQTIVATCLDGIKNQDESGIDCGGVCKSCSTPMPSCNDRIKNQDETGVDCGGVCLSCNEPSFIPDNDEIFSKVKSMGSFNENESLRLCNIINDIRVGDKCFHEMSKIFNQPNYCANINSNSLINICYGYFFTEKADYSVCESITDIYMKKSCESLKQIDSIMKQQNVSIT